MDLGITSKGGGVIRVMSGGRSMNQRLKNREKRGVCNKLCKRKERKRWNGMAMKKEKKRPTDSLGLVRGPKKKKKKKQRTLSEFNIQK